MLELSFPFLFLMKVVFFPVDITEIWEEELPEEKDAGIADEEVDEEDDEQDEDDHLSDENAVEGPEEDPCRQFSVCVLYVVEVRAYK